MYDINPFVPAILKVNLNPHRKLSPAPSGQVERRLSGNKEDIVEALVTSTNKVFNGIEHRMKETAFDYHVRHFLSLGQGVGKKP